VQESINEQRPKKIFADVKEVEITRAIAKEFYSVLQERLLNSGTGEDSWESPGLQGGQANQS